MPFVARNGDCDDEDAAINPSAQDLCNGLDDDCDGTVDEGASRAFRYLDGGTSDCDVFGEDTFVHHLAAGRVRGRHYNEDFSDGMTIADATGVLCGAL